MFRIILRLLLKPRVGENAKAPEAWPARGRQDDLAADRELKLAGYQIFRFGAHELLGDSAGVLVKTFFESLFKRYGVPVTYRP